MKLNTLKVKINNLIEWYCFFFKIGWARLHQ